MKTSLAAVLMIAALASAASSALAQSESPAPPPPPAGQAQAPAPKPAGLFVIHFTTGPQWDKAVAPHLQQGFAGHSANLKRLRTEEKLLLGARYGDKGMIVVRAADADAARAELTADPTIAAGVFVAAVEEFRPFYDGCVARAPSNASAH